MRKGQKKMQNTAEKAKQKYEKKLAKTIAKSGGIEFEYQGQDITAVLIAEPKGLYGADSIGTTLKIDAILQEVATAKVMAYNEEYGTTDFDFDFVGSKEECNSFLNGGKELTIAELLKDTTPEMKELLLKRAAEHHQEEVQGNGKDFEAYLNYAKDNYTSRVNAVDLLSLESGLLQNLQRVQEALSNQWSAEDTRTVREVLEDGR